MVQTILLLLIIAITTMTSCQSANAPNPIKLSLTVSSKLHHIEISWFNIKSLDGIIMITDREPSGPYRSIHIDRTNENRYYSSGSGSSSSSTMNQQYRSSDVSLIPITQPPVISVLPINNNNSSSRSINDQSSQQQQLHNEWIYGPDNNTALYWTTVNSENGWITTNIPFDMNLSRNLSIYTKCYGYWAVYLNVAANRQSAEAPVTVEGKTCISSHATWMTDNRTHYGKFQFHDLFLVGTHDSGSYRENFNPIQNETLVTKYSITQDDDIRGQLMHGVRYLDIRVGYYRASDPPFWVNHGISRQQPLIKILQQVRDFVLETDEIVIFDVQEFPVGFGKKLDIHRKLVHYIQNELGELMVDPELTWQATLEQIWKTKRNIIVSYDYISVVQEFPSLLWHSVQQRWGDVRTLNDLKRYLSPARRDFVLFTSRPMADMAELTPKTWDVITDYFGGLRTMADESNKEISKWYFQEWGLTTNIVAVDFYRGTSLMDTSLYWNMMKDNLPLK